MSMNAARRLLPSLSSSAVLWRAVRDGQLSKRKKMIRRTIPIMRAITAKASGHVIRCGFLDFDIWTFGVESDCSDAIEQEQDHEQEESAEGFNAKKLPPPTPDRREGRLFPPEQS